MKKLLLWNDRKGWIWRNYYYETTERNLNLCILQRNACANTMFELEPSCQGWTDMILSIWPNIGKGDLPVSSNWWHPVTRFPDLDKYGHGIRFKPCFYRWKEHSILPMVTILVKNSEHFAHARRKIGLFGEKKFRFVTRDQLIEMVPHVRTYFWVTFQYKYHDSTKLEYTYNQIISAILYIKKFE